MKTIKPTLKIQTRTNVKMCGETCPYLNMKYDNVDGGWIWSCDIFGRLSETKKMKRRHQNCLESEN